MPDFRKSYIQEILNRVKANARSELNVLWQEHEAGNTPFTHLTNVLSNKINEITDSIVNSELVTNKRLKERIIEEYTPECLVELTGLKNILKRVPDNYLNAIVATRLATGFIYKHGLQANEVDFYHYIGSFS
jgi:glutamate dehydrogenase